MAHSTWQGHTVNKSLYCISFQKEKNSSSRSVQTDSGDPVKLFLHNRLSKVKSPPTFKTIGLNCAYCVQQSLLPLPGVVAYCPPQRLCQAFPLLCSLSTSPNRDGSTGTENVSPGRLLYTIQYTVYIV